MDVYLYEENCPYCPDKVSTDILAISLNEWADLWPNTIFFFWDGVE